MPRSLARAPVYRSTVLRHRSALKTSRAIPGQSDERLVSFGAERGLVSGRAQRWGGPMDRPAGTALRDHFAALEDPRRAATVLQPLPEILPLLLGATVARSPCLVETEMWGEEHLA